MHSAQLPLACKAWGSRSGESRKEAQNFLPSGWTNVLLMVEEEIWGWNATQGRQLLEGCTCPLVLIRPLFTVPTFHNIVTTLQFLEHFKNSSIHTGQASRPLVSVAYVLHQRKIGYGYGWMDMDMDWIGLDWIWIWIWMDWIWMDWICAAEGAGWLSTEIFQPPEWLVQLISLSNYYLTKDLMPPDY